MSTSFAPDSFKVMFLIFVILSNSGYVISNVYGNNIMLNFDFRTL